MVCRLEDGGVGPIFRRSLTVRAFDLSVARGRAPSSEPLAGHDEQLERRMWFGNEKPAAPQEIVRFGFHVISLDRPHLRLLPRECVEV